MRNDYFDTSTLEYILAELYVAKYRKIKLCKSKFIKKLVVMEKTVKKDTK